MNRCAQVASPSAPASHRLNAVALAASFVEASAKSCAMPWNASVSAVSVAAPSSHGSPAGGSAFAGSERPSTSRTVLAYAKLDRRRSGAGGTRAPISGVQLGPGPIPRPRHPGRRPFHPSRRRRPVRRHRYHRRSSRPLRSARRRPCRRRLPRPRRVRRPRLAGEGPIACRTPPRPAPKRSRARQSGSENSGHASARVGTRLIGGSRLKLPKSQPPWANGAPRGPRS